MSRAATFLLLVFAYLATRAACDDAHHRESAPSTTTIAMTPTTAVPRAAVPQPPAAAASGSAGEPVPGPALAGSESANLARNFYFVLDGSGSMGEDPATKCSGAAKSSYSTKLAAARWAIGEFLGQVPADDRIGLYVFDRSGQREVVPLGTGNREQFLKAVNAVYAAGGTPLAEAIITGVNRLAAQRDQQLGYGDFRLVVVTDGEATGRRLEDGTAYALAKRIPIYTIGFCVGQTHTLFRHSVAYRAANSPAELRRGLEETLGELETFDMKAFGGQ